MKTNFRTMREIANTLLQNKMHEAGQMCLKMDTLASGKKMNDESQKKWRLMGMWLKGYSKKPSLAYIHPHTIWTQGNSKLPFLSFSTLHGEGFCPGAGECLEWCFSKKSWRYHHSFLRMLGNFALLQTPEGRSAILTEWDKKVFKIQVYGTSKGPVDCRLYVDGDFRTADEISFWMNAISERPKVNVYGYSKSLSLFITSDINKVKFPDNYVLNLSSGHKYDHQMEQDVSKILTIGGKSLIRGEFKAYAIDGKHSGTVRTSKERKALYAAHKKSGATTKAFVCPGQCGECFLIKGINKHACGDRDTFQDFSILIPVH